MIRIIWYRQVKRNIFACKKIEKHSLIMFKNAQLCEWMNREKNRCSLITTENFALKFWYEYTLSFYSTSSYSIFVSKYTYIWAHVLIFRKKTRQNNDRCFFFLFCSSWEHTSFQYLCSAFMISSKALKKK